MSSDLKRQVKVAFALQDKNQKWLAKQLKITESQLSDIINGKRHGKKTTEYIRSIKEILHIEADD
ncbi:XRE family transcriptional regulator [Levilactobacillus tujiorum]|uniref:XRE family transcriptional regulator n=1 Tax=Levilactobacillus tujiorum TaxID=2912243 RepID=UPI001457615E|nr:XRE family transcriptional regulator [Levilactobacillus tujiorum]NLR31360.1 XRE family transcriptional regulator [Levilactobacillus tujiorum]